MENNYGKYNIFRNLFFGNDTPLEANPIENEEYKKAWREIENIQESQGNNELLQKLIDNFYIADDERAFSSFLQGVELGRVLYSK